MLTMAEQVIVAVIATIIATIILAIWSYSRRKWLAQLKSAIILRMKHSPVTFSRLYIIVLALLDIVAYSVSNDLLKMLIFFANTLLLIAIWQLLQEKYNPKELQIISSTYGVNGQFIDVTNKVRSFIKDGEIDTVVSNETMGHDPYPGVTKELNVIYVAKYEEKVSETQYLKLPRPMDVHIHYGPDKS